MAPPSGLSESCRVVPLYKDIASQSIVCHMNFLFRHLIPKWFLEGWYHFTTKGIFDRFARTNLDISSTIFVGSYVDGLRIPHVQLRSFPTISYEHLENKLDMDGLIMTGITAGNPNDQTDLVIDTTSAHPGYFHAINRSDLSQHVSMIRILKDFLEIDNEFTDRHGLPKSEWNGPAITNKRDTDLDFDLVPTGTCPTWPRVAHAWKSRRTMSGWPPSDMKHSVWSNGCHFVIKAHITSVKPASECRFSFVIGEQILISSLSTAQKQCFLIFKTLVKYVLSRDSEISSYCLKTTLFWTLERVPKNIWEDEIHGLALCFLQLLDTLIHFLVDRNIPQYFIPENNLIGDTEPADIKRALHKLSRFRRQPVRFLLDYSNKYRCANNMIDLPEIAHMLSETVHQYTISSCKHRSVGECLVLHYTDTESYFHYVVRAECTSGAIGTMKTLQYYDTIAGTVPTDMTQYVHRLIEITSLILKMSPGLRPIIGFKLNFLFKLCTVLFLKNCGDTTDSAPEIVDKAFIKVPASFSTSVYYAMFHMCSGDDAKAIYYFECAFKFEIDKRHIMEYFHVPSLFDRLDDVLRLLVTENSFIRIPYHILAYYQLVRLYVKHAKTALAVKTIVAMEKACSAEKPESEYSNIGLTPERCVYLLLAFGYMHLRDYWSAAAAFQADSYLRLQLLNPIVDAALSIERPNSERTNICKAMAVYNWYIFQHIL